MTTLFERDKHYRQKSSVGMVTCEHTHWIKPAEVKVTSLLSFEFRASGDDNHSAVSSIDVWDVTPEELRALSEAMAVAANNLEAHHAEVADESASAQVGNGDEEVAA